MKKGFTLIELLVVVAIVGLMTTGAILGVTGSRHISSLDRSARELLLAIREAQNNSLVVQESKIGESAPCGYGIHDNNDGESILVFREETLPSGQDCIATSTIDQNIDRLYQASGGYGNDLIVETINLTESNYVKIDSNFDDTYFEPPDGLTYINGIHNNQIASTTDIVLCLRSDCENYRKTVRIYLGGNVEIID